MTPLLSTAIGLVIAALTGLLLLALGVAVVLLILLAILVLDHLLQRNGVDRRAAVDRIRSRMRGAGSRRRSASDAEHPAGSEAARSPRVPFSARRPRPPRQGSDPAPAPAGAVQTAPARTERAADEARTATDTAAPDRSTADAPDATVTQVLPAASPTSTPGATRAPRAQAPRARTPRAPKPPLRGPAAAAPAPAPSITAAEAAPTGERDSAIDRLFAPLLESEAAEEPGRPRSTRRPDGEA